MGVEMARNAKIRELDSTGIVGEGEILNVDERE